MSRSRWSIHKEGYLHSTETSFLAFHNAYPEGKQGGVEIIHHDERIASNGHLRVFLDPDREAGFSKLVERTADQDGKGLTAVTAFKDIDSGYSVRLSAGKDGVRLVVRLDKPLSAVKAVKAYFSIDFYPVPLWGRTYSMDKVSGVFPREISDPIFSGPDKKRDILSMASGREFTVTPDDPRLRITVRSLAAGLSLHDDRFYYEGGWFSLRCPVDVEERGVVLDWLIVPSVIPGWKKNPMIAVSQVGYHPGQPKLAVIELDPAWKKKTTATLSRLDPVRGFVKEYSAAPVPWGDWLRYGYAVFDFSSVKKEGTYRIDYEGSTAGPFRISKDIFGKGVWQPTLLEYFPVQMCHMEVWSGGRFWHAACHMDDAMQVESPFEYIDGYRQGPAPDTQFKPFEHIPHLNKGGWHDAGDTDLAAGSQIATTYVLCLCREEFGVDVDETTVIKDKNLVEMRTPDGVPDIIQQIEHGIESVLGGYRAAGHSFCGIIESIPRKYYQRGEVSAMTDNRVYDSSLKESDVEGVKSGLKDDRFAFTNRDSGLEYASVAVLAISARLLKGFNDKLGNECLETARKAWREERSKEPVRQKTTYVPNDLTETKVKAAVELYLSTSDRSYLDILVSLLPDILKSFERCAWVVARVLDRIGDPVFKKELQAGAAEYARKQKKDFASNPFGIAWKPFVWGIGWQLQDMAVRQYYLCKGWPGLFDKKFIFRVVDWVLGCHPGNNVSFVSGVGTRSLTEAFGINRADWSYIAGGNASGVALIKPDFPELKIGYPWLWQQSEYVMSGAATWIFSVLAAEAILKKKG